MADTSPRSAQPPNAQPTPNQVVVRLRLIGQMEAWTVTSESVLPAGRKTRALLASVALSAPRPALRGRLAELLWSRRPEEQARASLRQEIHRLLEALSPAKTDILLHQVDATPTFDILVRWSHAADLWAWLKDAAASSS